MTPKRYAIIRQIALSAMHTMKRYGSVQMQKLAKCTLDEVQWLQANRPTILPFTRIFDYEATDYKEDSSRPVRAKRPTVREIWVGARSLASIHEDGDASEGMARNQAEDEDTAELTDLQTLLYHDAKTGLPLITDEDGVTRPIRPGDIIQIAWGSNEDLDALFMEEASDPRSESDQLWRELTRDQIRVNNYQETEFLNDPTRSVPREALEETLTRKDDIRLWDEAHKIVEDHLALHTEETRTYRELADFMFLKLRDEQANIQFGEKGLEKGQFLRRKDYFDAVETNLRTLNNVPKKSPPKAVPAEVFKRTPNPFLSQPSKRPVVKPGQRWLHISRHGTKDLTGLAQQFIGPVMPRTSSMTNKV